MHASRPLKSGFVGRQCGNVVYISRNGSIILSAAYAAKMLVAVLEGSEVGHRLQVLFDELLTVFNEEPCEDLVEFRARVSARSSDMVSRTVASETPIARANRDIHPLSGSNELPVRRPKSRAAARATRSRPGSDSLAQSYRCQCLVIERHPFGQQCLGQF